MLQAAEEGRFKTLYFFDLSRLARESVITITTLKKLVYVYKVRVVSVSEGIDSANEGWFTLATILGLQHEQYLKTLSANVMRGLVGSLLQDLSLGDYCFGYSSVPIEGAPLRGKGRNARPPKKYVIAEEEADWVRKIFVWFVRERRSVQWIVRELNSKKAPKDHRKGTTEMGPQWRPSPAAEDQVYRHLALGDHQELPRSPDRPDLQRVSARGGNPRMDPPFPATPDRRRRNLRRSSAPARQE